MLLSFIAQSLDTKGIQCFYWALFNAWIFPGIGEAVCHMVTLSIIVPTYNVEKYIGRCLASLPCYREDIEIIVIIDGSKDNSCEIAKSYQARFPNTIKVIEKENGHYGSCVNKGLSLAKGKYIKLLDADDYYSPSFVDYLDFLGTTDADVVLTDSIKVDEEEVPYDKYTFSFTPFKTLSMKDLIKSNVDLLHNYELTFRTQMLIENNYRQSEHISYTDLEWSSLPFSVASSFVYAPINVYCYYIGRVGQSIDIEFRKKNMWMENKVVIGLAEKYEEIKDNIETDNAILLKRFISSLVRQIYFHYLINYPSQLNEDELSAFDRNLFEKSKDVYISVDNVVDRRKFGAFYYIKDFRNNGTRDTLRYRFFDNCVRIGALLRNKK